MNKNRDVYKRQALDAAEGLPEYDGGGLSVFGCGRSALYARLARRLDPRIQSLTCEGGVESYSCLLYTSRCV